MAKNSDVADDNGKGDTTDRDKGYKADTYKWDEHSSTTTGNHMAFVVMDSLRMC